MPEVSPVVARSGFFVRKLLKAPLKAFRTKNYKLKNVAVLVEPK